MKSCTESLIKNEQKKTKISKRSIQHVTLDNMSHAEVFTLGKVREFEKQGEFIKANWLRAKASEDIFITPDKKVQRFRELSAGGEGKTDLVFKEAAGPLEVKKILYNESDAESKAEIALLKRLDHPNIIKVLPDVPAEHEKGTHFMTDGGQPVSKLAPTPENPKPLSRPLFISIGKQMASALDYLNKKKVLHRDIKPQNMVGPKGHPALIDFGMAYDGQAKTACNPLGIGTLYYLEPDANPYYGVKYSDTGNMFAAGQTLFELIL